MSAIGYPFTAPDVSPATMRRWKKSTNRMIGIVMITAAAQIEPGGAGNWGEPGRRADGAGGRGELGRAGEEPDCCGHGPGAGRRGERDGEEEVVPAEDE